MEQFVQQFCFWIPMFVKFFTEFPEWRWVWVILIPGYNSWLQLYEGGNEDKCWRDFTGMFIWFSCQVLWCCENRTLWCLHFCLVRRVWGSSYPMLSGSTFCGALTWWYIMKCIIAFLESLTNGLSSSSFL